MTVKSRITMVSTPRINIVSDVIDDIRLFLRYLNHPDYPGKKQVILKFYPTLSELLSHAGDEKTIVDTFVMDMYKRHHIYIKTITKALKEEVAKASSIFALLDKIMNYANLGQIAFNARTTFLPFSPLTDGGFYLSIGRLPQDPRRLLFTAVHEISHHILLCQLHDWERNTGIIMNHPAVHYLKESVTGAIMDNPMFNQYFDYKELFNEDTYKGNIELHNFMVQHSNNTTVNIVTYVKQHLHTDESIPYKRKLHSLFLIFSNNQESFSNQWNIWNAWQTASNDTELLTTYRKPIVLKE